MLGEEEIRNLKSMMQNRSDMIVDPVEKKCHRAFIAGLECVLND